MNGETNKLISAISPIIILVLALSAGAGAQDQGTGNPSVRTTVPLLNGVRIIQTNYLPDPFINTSIRNTLGYGQTSAVKIPLFEINGQPVTGIRGSLLFAQLGFEYQYRVQSWMGVWIRMGFAARMGTGLQSLLSQGVSATSGFEIGWLFRLWHTERHQLSAGVAVRNSSSTIVDIYSFIKNAVEAGGITEDNQIIKNAPAISSGPDLRYAYTMNNFLALTAFLRLSYGESPTREKGNEFNYGAGGMLHIDLDRKFASPVGMGIGYHFSTIPEDGDIVADNVQTYFWKISYIGRTDFEVGLDLALQRTPLRGLSGDVNYLSALIAMNYFF